MKSAANIFLSIFSFALFFSGGSSHPKKQRAVGIAFYNVENLFDTLDDKSINDNEFLPNGEKKWNTEKYNAKLSRIADALNSISHELPAFVGFAEVENHKVLEDLATVKLLNRAKYKIVHFDSPDTRGIDVGFFYSKKKVKSVNALSIPVNTGAENRPTRDILLVECALKKGPQVYFFINHWPSRYGGQEKTEPKRISASHTLARHVDSLFSIDPKAIIIAMGDFNDYPENHSIQDILIGQRNSKLINLMETAISEYPGSYSYKNEWGYLDQFVVSKSLVDSVLPEIRSHSTRAYSKPRMIHKKKNGNDVPNRTYGGKNYYGGYSDHLPIYTELIY